MRSVRPNDHWPLAVLLSLSLVGGGASAYAADDSVGRSSLKGLKAIGLVVEKMPLEAETEGLTREQVQKDIELRLKDAGVPVAKEAAGFLYVNLQLLKPADAAGHAYAIGLEFTQPVLLVRDTKILVLGTTWSLSATGTATPGKLAVARVDVVKLVDKFVSAYQSVNPR